LDWRRIRRRKDPEETGPSDARPLSDLADEPAGGRPRPFYRGRGVTFVLGVIFATGAVAWLFADGGFVELSRLRGQRAELRRELADRRARVAALESRVQALHNDPSARERIAREQLGYAREGEIVFLLPREEDEATAEEP